MKKQLFKIVVSVFLACPNVALAYEPNTHEDLSENAVNISDLRQHSSVLTDLGLEPLGSKQTFPNSKGNLGKL